MYTLHTSYIIVFFIFAISVSINYDKWKNKSILEQLKLLDHFQYNKNLCSIIYGIKRLFKLSVKFLSLIQKILDYFRYCIKESFN